VLREERERERERERNISECVCGMCFVFVSNGEVLFVFFWVF
jgi:hypothetical protein